MKLGNWTRNTDRRAPSTGHRAPSSEHGAQHRAASTEHRAPGNEYRAQSTECRAPSNAYRLLRPKFVPVVHEVHSTPKTTDRPFQNASRERNCSHGTGKQARSSRLQRIGCIPSKTLGLGAVARNGLGLQNGGLGLGLQSCPISGRRYSASGGRGQGCGPQPMTPECAPAARKCPTGTTGGRRGAPAELPEGGPGLGLGRTTRRS